MHALKREFVFNTYSFERFGKHLFHEVHDIFTLNEAHLDVYLGEFGLAIRTKIFVAETACDLIVAFNATDHEHLLELLRRLRQCVERARVRTRRNDVVTCAFWGGIRKDRGLDLKKSMLVQG